MKLKTDLAWSSDVFVDGSAVLAKEGVIADGKAVVKSSVVA